MSAPEALTGDQIEAYLRRIGMARPRTLGLDTLEQLQRAHLTAVPFENLHVAAGIPVRTDVAWSYDKIVEQGRGGWCFELNGAFAALLEGLGFRVRRLGAAVIRRGPSDVVDHLTLEVASPDGFGPHLVDVGFGDSFCRPLDLNNPELQDGGSDRFQLVPSPRGTTLVREREGRLDPEFRFKRVTLDLPRFDPASERLQTDPDSFFVGAPFATRLLHGGPDRVTAYRDRLKIVRAGEITETALASDRWEATLHEWFGLGPTTR